MKRIALLLLAPISLAILSVAATRPHYGGTLRVGMQTSPNTLAMPGSSDPTDYRDMARVLSLIGDTLVSIDAQGRPQAALATSWAHDSTTRHWQLTLRRGVKFHDGRSASAAEVVQILAAIHPNWTLRLTTGGFSSASASSSVNSAADSLTIDTDAPAPALLAELALPRNLILVRNASGIPIGTGPFRVTEFQPGKGLKLAASDECWSGRPFVDSIEIEFGKSLRDELLSVELGRADVVEAAPESSTGPHARVSSSLPVDLMALVFSPAANSSARDPHVREALALSIDRRPIQSAVLKGAGEPCASILPNWMTGFSAAIEAQQNLTRAKALSADLPAPKLTLSYDPRDSESQLIAERIALNAREVGVSVQVTLSNSADVHLVRIAIVSPDPSVALKQAARDLLLSEPAVHSNSVDDLYEAERSLLDGNGVIPLFHLPVAASTSLRVRAWSTDRLGIWRLDSLWLEGAR